MKQFLLPDPGEGLVEAEIVAWHVAVGDTVEVNDVVVDIETSKSLVELPIPWAGTVTQLLVDEGQTVAIGTPIIVIDDGVEEPAAPATPSADEAPGPMLVGYGPKAGATSRRARRGRSGNGQDAVQAIADSYDTTAPPSRRSDDVTEPHRVVAEPHGAPLPTPGEAPRGSDLVLVNAAGEVLAKPPVRKLAAQLGVDLAQVAGTGPGGVITRGDVEAAAAIAKLREQQANTPRNSWQAEEPTDEFGNRRPYIENSAGQRVTGDFSGGEPTGPAFSAVGTAGGERRVPIKGVRKVTAEAMRASVDKHVHVTEWTTVDVTATVELVNKLKNRREFSGLRVSPLLVYAKAVCMAMANTPEINASWDEDAQEIVYYDEVNLGIATATPRGLMVPNIKGAQRRSLLELCQQVNTLVQVAREGRLQPSDYSGGTFTITNVGVFGVESGTPVINRDESAILCMGSIDRKPWVVGSGEDERIEPRWVTTVSLSFDHKLIDGEQGSRFLHEVTSLLADPELAMLY